MELKSKNNHQGILSSKFLQKIVSTSAKVTPKGKNTKTKIDLSAIQISENYREIDAQGSSTERSGISSITETIKKKRKDLNAIESYLTRPDGTKKPLKRSTSEKNMNNGKNLAKPLKTQASDRSDLPSIQKGFVNLKKEQSKIRNELKDIFNSKFFNTPSRTAIDRKYSKSKNTSKIQIKTHKDPLQIKEEAFRKEKLREKRLVRFYAVNRKPSSKEKSEEEKKNYDDDSTGTTISYYKVDEIEVELLLNQPEMVQIFLCIETIINRLIQNLDDKGQILNIIKEYITKISLSEIEIQLKKQIKGFDSNLSKNFKLERIGVVIMVIVILSCHIDRINQTFLLHMLQYIHKNTVTIIDILYPAIMKMSEYSAIATELMKKNEIKEGSGVSHLEQNNKVIESFIYYCLDLMQVDISNILREIMKNFKDLSLESITSSLLDILDKTLQVHAPAVIKEWRDDSKLSFIASPYLPPIVNKKFTLVLDLDETLIHFKELEDNAGEFLVRPYAEEFILNCAPYFEIVIYTAALQDYADFILNLIDPQKVISHRLYRKHTVPSERFYIKDLSLLGRDLSKTIIIDNTPENFILQPENGIYIKSWYGDPYDKALINLEPLLIKIPKRGVNDVRDALKSYKFQMIENIENGVDNPLENLRLNF